VCSTDGRRLVQLRIAKQAYTVPYVQVVDEIVQILTDPKFMGKMVVILAGYEQAMEELMTVNPGEYDVMVCSILGWSYKPPSMQACLPCNALGLMDAAHPCLLCLACAGLRSRFSEKVKFPDFTVEDTVQLVRQQVLKDNLTLAPDAEAALPQLAAKVCALACWGKLEAGLMIVGRSGGAVSH
jgi:hypothetical protein